MIKPEDRVRKALKRLSERLQEQFEFDNPSPVGQELIKLMIQIVEESEQDVVEQCARLAENPKLHTASMTDERSWAEKLCPRIGKAVREMRNYTGTRYEDDNHGEELPPTIPRRFG